jgi:SAM-dependent methyltransferase
MEMKAAEHVESFIFNKIRPYIPFSALNTVWRKLDKNSRTILDVGCGKGEPMTFINRKGKFKAVGIDIFKPYLEKSKRKGVYQDLILGDVRFLPFKENSFDAIICLEVLEHLEKQYGEYLLSELERVARKQILLTTPVGRYELHPFEGNPYQEHKHIWSPEELKEKGYNKVRGVGFRGMGGEQSLAFHLPCFLQPFRCGIYSLGTLFSYFFPKISCHMVAERKK